MADYEIPAYRREPRCAWSPVDGIGYLMLAAESVGSPGVVGTSMLFEGPMVVEAMQEALRRALERQPVFSSRLAALGTPPRQRLVWLHRGVGPDLELIDRGDEGPPAGDPDDWLAGVDLNVIAWEPDLTVEPPIRLRLTAFSEDCHVLTMWMHHAAGDGSGMGIFLLELHAAYHELVRGEQAEWAFLPAMHAELTAVPLDLQNLPSWLEIARLVKESVETYPPRSLGWLAGTEGQAAPISVSRTIRDDDLVADVRARARSLGGSLTDVCVAASMVALGEWSEQRGSPIEVQYFGIPVNLRGRMPGIEESGIANAWAQFLVGSKASEWADPVALATRVAARRRSYMDSGELVRGMQIATFLESLITKLTVRRQLRISAAVPRGSTMIVTNVGILFPEIVDGEFTGRPGMQEVGGMRITSSVVQTNTAVAVPNTLSLVTAANGFNLELSGNRSRCTLDELGEVLDLTVDRLADFAG